MIALAKSLWLPPRPNFGRWSGASGGRWSNAHAKKWSDRGGGGAVAWVNAYSTIADAVNEYAEGPDTSINSEFVHNVAFSIAFWAKPSSTAGTKYVFSNIDADEKGLEVYFAAGAPRMQIAQGWSVSKYMICEWNHTATAGVWDHYLYTYDGSNHSNGMKLYVNGTLKTKSGNSTVGTIADSTGPNKLRLFAAPVYGLYYAGQLEEFATWTSNQSANASDIYHGGATHDLSALSAAPAHWYRMGDGDTYPTISDNSGSYDFTMTNMEAGDFTLDVP